MSDEVEIFINSALSTVLPTNAFAWTEAGFFLGMYNPGLHKRTTLFRVKCEGYIFALQVDAGLTLIRNSTVARLNLPECVSVDKACLFVQWTPVQIDMFMHGVARLADGSWESIEDITKVKTPPTTPPLLISRWLRKQKVAHVQTYKDEVEFTRVILWVLSSLSDILKNTEAKRQLWDVTYEGSRIHARKPKRETDCQEWIHTMLHDVAAAKSLEVIPEAGAAGGSMDFYIVGVLNSGAQVRACVEVKHAHSDDIEHGVVTQLPAYMAARSTDLGFYVVLWFQCSTFDKPSGSQYDLAWRLNDAQAAAGRRSLPVVMLDASLPIAPSQL